MAEAVAALSLAANIVQVTEFGFKFVTTAWKFWQSKQEEVEAFQDLEILAQHFGEVILQIVPLDPATGSGTVAGSQAIHQTAAECKTTVDEILGSIDKIGLRSPVNRFGQGRNSKRDAARNAFKLIWKSDDIKALQTKLEGIRSQATLSILASVRSCAMESLGVQNQILQELHRLRPQSGTTPMRDRGFGSEIVSFLTHEQRLDDEEASTSIENSFRDELLGVLYNEETLTLEGPDVQKFQITPARRDHLQRKFLSSLEFDGMHSREAAVAKAHKSTFRWIFKEERQQARPWNSLKAWLKSDHQLYWITGKAGSGKSTLMKFISQPPTPDGSTAIPEPRCMPYLRQWSCSKPLAFASFYFWAAGTKLHTSQEGLFRTLLYQILGQYPNMVPRLFPQHWAALSLFDQSARGFTQSVLEKALLTLVHEVTIGANLCLFIDGLDEFDGDHGSLIELLKGITQQSSVKICVSSRPWLVFEESLKNKPSLRLEDLTFHDIKHYVKSQFRNNSDFALLQRQEPEFTAGLIKNVVCKASGVFLWVKLVVSSLLDGMKYGDRVSDLQKRLDALPPDLDDLYGRILDQLSPSYLEHASQYFSLMSAHGEPPSAILFSLADEDDIRSVIELSVDPTNWQPSNLEDRIEYLRKRLNSRCKGLIEIERPSYDPTLDDDRASDESMFTLLERPRVHYLHKTVKDYMDKPEVQRRFLETAKSSFDPHLRLCSAKVAMFKIAGHRLILATKTSISELGKLNAEAVLAKLAADAIFHARHVTPKNLPKMVHLLDHLGAELDLIESGVESFINLVRFDIHRNERRDYAQQDWDFLSPISFDYLLRPDYYINPVSSIASFAVQGGLAEFVEARVSHNPMPTSTKARGTSPWHGRLIPWHRSRRNDHLDQLLYDSLIVTVMPDPRIVSFLLKSGARTDSILDFAIGKIILFFGCGVADLAPKFKATWMEIARLMLEYGPKRIKQQDIGHAFRVINSVWYFTISGVLNEKQATEALLREFRFGKDGRRGTERMSFDFLSGLKLASCLRS
ncbi:hypothetical protein QBC44DRAFT_385972 [Cladorrhinum sp. PSN332]|nr:hypothetical protein QBC44DRAFT_385972 [Cladorrhinum sp. PSN332]